MTAGPLTAGSLSTPEGGSLPWAGLVRLAPGENVLATGRFDLDSHLRFNAGWIVLTNKRLIADEPASADVAPAGALGPREWRLDSDSRLDVQLRSAVGRIELSSGDRVVARAPR